MRHRVEIRLRPLEIFTREDLANVIAALVCSETRTDDYFVALQRVGMAFGIDVYEVPESEQSWHIGSRLYPQLEVDDVKTR
jgi:hypothetical protein